LKHVVLCLLLAGFTADPVFGQELAPVQGVALARDVGTVEQRAWLAASPHERTRLAEKLGDDGARSMAKRLGLQPIYDGLDRTIPQGPDQVYRGSNGRTIVYEAKGGGSPLSRAYGHAQGSPEWAVKSAERLLKSSYTSQLEKGAARQIIDAAANQKLDVHVVRTQHTLGLPMSAVIEAQSATTRSAGKLAKQVLASLPQSSQAAATAKAGSGTKGVFRGLAVVGVAVDANDRIRNIRDANLALAEGVISREEREVAVAREAAGMAGGWGGAVAGAKGGGSLGLMVGGPWGATGGAIVGGIAGYVVGEAAAAQAADWGVSKLHDAGTTIESTWKNAW